MVFRKFVNANSLYNPKLHYLPRLAWLVLSLSCIELFSLLYIVTFDLTVSKQIATALCFVAILVSISPVIYLILQKKSSYIFSGIVVFNLAPIWSLYLEAALSGYDANTYSSPQVIVLALVYISIFQIFVNFFYCCLYGKIIALSKKTFSFISSSLYKPRFFLNASLVAFFIPLIAFAIFYGSLNTLWVALTSGRSGGGGSGLIIRGAVGDSSSFMLPFLWIWQTTPLLSSIGVFAPYEGKGRRYLSICCSFLVMIVFFLGGSRAIMVAICAPYIFFFLYSSFHKRFSFIIKSVSILFLFVGAMELQVRFRGNLLDVLFNAERATAQSGYRSLTSFDLTETHRDNNMYLFCLMLKHYPKKKGFEGFNETIAMLVNPVPRAIWPSKPILRGAKNLDTQEDFVSNGPLEIGTTSLTYSIVGEAYLADGLFGILIYAIIFAVIIVFFEGTSFYEYSNKPLSLGLLSTGLFLSFWGYRSLFALITFSYPVIFMIILLKYFTQHKSRFK